MRNTTAARERYAERGAAASCNNRPRHYAMLLIRTRHADVADVMIFRRHYQLSRHVCRHAAAIAIITPLLMLIDFR